MCVRASLAAPTPVGVQLGIAMDLPTMRPCDPSLIHRKGGRGGSVQSARFRSLAPVSDIARRGGWHREVRGHDTSEWAVRVSRTNFFAAAHPPGFPGSPGHRSRRTWPSVAQEGATGRPVQTHDGSQFQITFSTGTIGHEVLHIR